ncbi:MTH938/NDUFAF3 family protein [Sphingomonas sp.]|uniref:MTH938/NDUFAF3 family protein n=1 Tax=Sphingomonas sp. TaxID=28214 RepID=UPI0035BBAFA1
MEAVPTPGGPIVTGLVGTGFRLGEALYPAVLMTHEAVARWSPPPLADLDEAALAPILQGSPEFVVLGTGRALVRPPGALVKALEARDVGIEPMDSRAAARAWGVLRAEGRAIVAALYPLDA